MGTKTGWSDMIAVFHLSKPGAYYRERYHSIILDQYRQRSAAEPGALDLVAAIRRARLPVAVASSSVRPWVEACLERIGLAHQFDVIVTGSEVDQGKPDPAIYLRAAGALGVDPTGCLAIEDAPAGIESAKRAGMVCWAVRTEYTRGLRLPDPHREVASLAEIDPTDVVGVPA